MVIETVYIQEKSKIDNDVDRLEKSINSTDMNIFDKGFIGKIFKKAGCEKRVYFPEDLGKKIETTAEGCDINHCYLHQSQGLYKCALEEYIIARKNIQKKAGLNN